MFNRVVNAYRRQFPLVTLTMTEMPTLRHEPLVLVAPAHHPLLDTEAVRIRDLAGYPFVTFLPTAGTGIQPQVLRLCRAAGFVPDIALQAGEGSTIIGLVAAGCGISILPESFTGIRVKGIRYRTLADADAVTQLMLARRLGERSPLADAFFELAGQLSTQEGKGDIKETVDKN